MEFDSNITYRNLPSVVLTGRPNVGKSTLFNRLLRQRRAITDPTPGVTRDPIEADCLIAGKLLRLIDTGGFKLADCEGIDKLVVAKTLDAVKRATIVVLLLEAGDITSEDEEFIERLRPYRDKLIVAVNKTEGGRKQADAWNVLSLGFEKILMISAEHGDNIGELEQEIIKRINFSEFEAPAEEKIVGAPARGPIRVALLGKPNTGKSTLSNRLTGANASIVSEIPGTTRDTVRGDFSWKSRDFVIIDTAGIRRKSKVTENIEYYSVNRAIKTIDETDIIILMIDAEEGLTDQDKKIAALAHDKGRGIIMALNKWDTMPQHKNTFKTVSERIHFLFGQMEYAPIIPVSAKDGTGVDKLLSTAVKMYNQLNLTISTSHLNQALEKWLTEYPPPTGPRTRFKLRYAVQKSANPVHFIIFASRKHAVNDTYISYLRNKIRKDLGFSMVPVLVEVKASSGK